jgi:DNA repair exonuclease SbcCD ATPase subunit
MASSAADEAQRMINDLQAQVRLLNSKAAAAVDRLADYEDEIRLLRAEKQAREAREAQAQSRNSSGYSSQMQGGFNNPSAAAHAATQASPPPPQYQQSRLSSLRSLLGGGGNTTQRRNPSDAGMDFVSGVNNTLTASNTPAPHPGTSTALSAGFNHQPDPFHTLQSTLASERELRLKAETNLTQTQMELEELTAQLFGQANEMVAEERRARSKLEDRVRVLEKREREKGERLRKLEGRIERVERVRGMLG